MGKTSSSKNRSNKKRRRKPKQYNNGHSNSLKSNFLSDAGPGCYIARRDLNPSLPDWMLEWEDVDKDDFADEEVPELAIDPEEKTLSVCNNRDKPIIAYISVLDTPLLGRNEKQLKQGSTTNNDGVKRDCITFIVLCPPHVFAHLCYLDVPQNTNLFEDIPIESDVQEWNRHPNPDDEYNGTVGFPLQGGPFRCTQGEGGQLTHFFNGNLHAIDFRCPTGTPLLAVGSGRVIQSKDSNTLTGIAVGNLFEWNSIMIQIDDEQNETPANPLYVEYVHIQKSYVKEGEAVSKGQVIGETGSVGFSPEPHLHFAAYRTKADTAPTVRVKFQPTNPKDTPFLPRAGLLYNAEGEQRLDEDS